MAMVAMNWLCGLDKGAGFFKWAGQRGPPQYLRLGARFV
jgi:hypothetical protein